MNTIKQTYKTVLALLCAIALVAPFATQAASYEEALEQAQADILAAFYSGDRLAIQQHFLVYFEILSLADEYDYEINSNSSRSVSSNGSISIETKSASNIDEEDAKLRGEIDLSGGSRAYVWFEYGEDDDDLDHETSREYVTRDSDVSTTIRDLDEDERYHFRLVAENRDTGRLAYGDIEDFETDDDRRSNNDDVDVDTLSANNIDEREATLRGEVTEGDDVEVWFAFDEDDSTPSCSSNSQREDPDGDDEYDEDEIFELDIDGLDEDEKYYYRACAEDEDGDEVSGSLRSFTTDEEENNNDQEPDVETHDEDDVRDDSAELNGEVDMNDFKNGTVFFVWGESREHVEDVEDEDEYADVDEDGEDLQKQRVDSDLDGQDDYSLDIDDLDDDTQHYYAICVEYEDEDGDEVIECGGIEAFRTDD